MSDANIDDTLVDVQHGEAPENAQGEGVNIPALDLVGKASTGKTKVKKTKVVTWMKIGTVAEFFKVNTSVLRFWEEEFPQLQPMRTETGQRLYAPKDIALIKKIKKLLHADGLTISGAKKILNKTPLPKGNEGSRISLGNIPVLSLNLPQAGEEAPSKDLPVNHSLSADDKEFLLEVEQELLALKKLLTSK